jgi:Mor family transcriptional regulator
MIYKWKTGSRFHADAQIIGEALERIPLKTAETVVETAREKTSSLHDCFEWDDTVAACEHRKDQARLLLRSIVINVETENDNGKEEIQVRAFESVRLSSEENNGMVYVPIKTVLSDIELRKQVLNRLNNVIEDAEQTARAYSYLTPILKKTAKYLKEAQRSLGL